MLLQTAYPISNKACCPLEKKKIFIDHLLLAHQFGCVISANLEEVNFVSNWERIKKRDVIKGECLELVIVAHVKMILSDFLNTIVPFHDNYWFVYVPNY